MIGGINSSIKKRIVLVEERFIFEALGRLSAEALHPDCASDDSAERFQTQVLLEMMRRVIRYLRISAKIFVRRLLSPLIGSSPDGKCLPPEVFLWQAPRARSKWFGLAT